MSLPVFAHEEGCTPLEPCRACQVVSFLKEKLEPRDFKEFIKLLQTAPPVAPLATQEKPAESPADDRLPLDTPLKRLEVNVRTRNMFLNLGLNTVHDLLQKTELELMMVDNYGRKSLNELKEVLRNGGRYIGELASQ